MTCLKTLILSALVKLSWCYYLDGLKFPPGFKFGAATSAYQVEGAWNVSDKSESNWDRLTHNWPDTIEDGSSGDVACNSYTEWRRDIQMAVELGLDFYRFSISWPRLLPNGFSNYISKVGAAYYSNLIDELLRQGIEPAVTIFHFDLPHSLQELGGWTNPLITEWFADYARVVFSLYADRVKTWFTINEPIILCDYTYNEGDFPPLLVEPEVAPFICTKNVLIAHAKAWRIYDQEFRSKFHGQVSIVNHLIWFQPVFASDSALAELAMQRCTGQYSHPIYSQEGGWPPAIEDLMAAISRGQGYKRSRLPSFTEEEKRLVKGTYDFYAMNFYTSREIRPARPREPVGPWMFSGWPDMNAVLEVPEQWGIGASQSLAIYPPGLRHQLAWLKKEYGDISILITENGYSNFGQHLVDDDRIDFVKEHLKQILLSIKEDGVNVTGYTMWSLMDNFEWTNGYEVKFGVYEVDFNDPARPRTPRKSAYFYANVIKENSLNIPRDYYARRNSLE